MKLNDVNLKDLYKYINNVADNKELDAGMGGRHDDGGARILRQQISFYQMGRNGTIPSDWERYANELKNEKDPEYAKYLELKKKFE